jgi:hypothetical protein
MVEPEQVTPIFRAVAVAERDQSAVMLRATRKVAMVEVESFLQSPDHQLAEPAVVAVVQ